MSQEENSEKSVKKDGRSAVISFVSLLIVLLSFIEIYEIINDPSNLIAMGVLGTFILAAVYADTVLIRRLSEKRAKEQEEAFNNVFRSEKASYLLLRKYFDQMDQKMEMIEKKAAVPYQDLVNAQKALAKVQINRNKENSDAFKRSNDKVIQRLMNFQKILENSTKGGISDQEKAAFMDGNKDILVKQQEILAGLKEMEASLRSEILESTNKIAEMKMQQVSIPQPQIQVQEQDSPELNPLDIEDTFSMEADDLTVKPITGSSSESDLDNLLMGMEDELQQIMEEPELEPIMEEPALEPIMEEPELEPIMEEPVLEPIMEEPELEPIMEEPALEPIMEEPELEPIMEEPVLEPIMEEPALEPIMEEPALEPIMEEPELEPIMEEPELEPIVEEPVLEPIMEEPALEQPIIEEPVLEPIMEEPELEPMIEGPELEPIMEESELEPIMKEQESQPIMEEMVIEPIMEDSGLESVIEETNLQPIAEEPALQPLDEELVIQPIMEETEPVIDEMVLEPITMEEPESVSLTEELSEPKEEQIIKPIMMDEEPAQSVITDTPELHSMDISPISNILDNSELMQENQPSQAGQVPESEMIIQELNFDQMDAPQTASAEKEVNSEPIVEELQLEPAVESDPEPAKETELKEDTPESELKSMINNLDIDKIFVEPDVEIKADMPELSEIDNVMNAEEIAALIANTDSFSEPEPEVTSMPDLSDPGHVMNADEIAALLANL